MGFRPPQVRRRTGAAVLIAELALCAVATAAVVAPAAGYAGARLRATLPWRMPSSATRVKDAEADLRIHEISRERRQLDFNMERDDLIARDEIDQARQKVAERERLQLVEAEGEEHKVLEARLFDAARRAFPDGPWGTTRSADDVLETIERQADRLRADVARVRAVEDALRRAQLAGRLPVYLLVAAERVGLLP